MALLAELRQKFSRRKNADHHHDGPTVETTGKSAGDLAHNVQYRPGRTMETKPSKARTLAELQRGYEEVIRMVRKISDHLDDQASRTAQMVEFMERLPKALDALPEINRQNARLMEMLGDHLEHVRTRDEAMNSTLTRINESAHDQTEVLGMIRQQMDANNRASTKMTEGLETFRLALGDLASSSSRSVEVLTDLADKNNIREAHLTQMLSRTQRWMILAICGCGVASGAALVAAVIMLISAAG